MLSRVAENIYWVARYMERAESTARLVTVNAHLLLDLPRGIAPGWGPIVEILGSRALLRELHGKPTERKVLRYLVGDPRNPSSIVASLGQARENARTIRDIVPREAWEQINGLHHFVREELRRGLSKGGRHDYLQNVIRGVQLFSGLLMGTMSRDEGYQFFVLGAQLERGDMTTRIVDVRSASLLPTKADLAPFETIQWMSVLKSLTGYQMYRRKMQLNVRREEVLRFLFQDGEFPRSVAFCLGAIEGALRRLPRNRKVLPLLERVRELVLDPDVPGLEQSRLHDRIDDMQVTFGALHDGIGRTYFPPLEAPAEASSAA